MRKKLLRPDLRHGQLVRLSKDEDEFVSKIHELHEEHVVLYTGHVHRPWRLEVREDGALIDPADARRVHLWEF